jgi:predicted dehydrogenase
LQEDRRISLVGAADPDGERRAAAARAFRGLPLFASTEEMLASLASDVLVIAAAPAAHARLVTLGVRHRQHIVCEKPLTLTREQHRLVVDSFAGEDRLGLVPVHQYRYSPTWQLLGQCGRMANRLGLPFFLEADVHRNGGDRRAATPWRADAASGGMLADHGVHFLALGWTISRQIEPIVSARRQSGGRGERTAAHLRLGSGRMRVRLCSASPSRSTRVDLRLAGAAISWHDSSATARLGGRTLGRWRTAAISDRSHVDALYLSLYREIASNLADPRWRASRIAEALTVNGALVSLLEQEGPRGP